MEDTIFMTLGILGGVAFIAMLAFNLAVAVRSRRSSSIIYWPTVVKFHRHTVIARRFDGTLEEVPRGQFSPYMARHENCAACGTAPKRGASA